MKEFLSREGHPFIAKNVEEDDGAFDELVALGFRAVPVTVVGARAIVGFNPAELKAALATSQSQSDR